MNLDEIIEMSIKLTETVNTTPIEKMVNDLDLLKEITTFLEKFSELQETDQLAIKLVNQRLFDVILILVCIWNSKKGEIENG